MATKLKTPIRKSPTATISMRKAPARKPPTPEDFTFPKKAFYSPAEIAEILGISDQTVMDVIHAEKLWAVQVGPRTYRVPLGALMQFLGVPPQIRWTRNPNAIVDPNEDDELDREEAQA